LTNNDSCEALSDPSLGLYLPIEASELALALPMKVSWAAWTFSSLPAHFLMHDDYKALPYENDNAQGCALPLCLFMASNSNVASSSLWPPDKNTIPGTAGTTVLDKAARVLWATSVAVILSLLGSVYPGVTIFGFNNIPSKKIWLSWSALKTAAKTFYEICKHLSIEWFPSLRISGSTIGTNPFS